MRMPSGTALVDAMTKLLPLYCYSNKRNTKALLAQGFSLNNKTKLEVIGVRDFGEAGGVMCDIPHPNRPGNVIIMSVTGLDFIDNGAIDDEITAYKNARIEWLKEEERRDREQNLGERIKSLSVVNERPKISRNAPCPCGSGKKYKHCCGK